MKGGGSWQEALANKGKNWADKDRIGRLELRNKRCGHDQPETRGDGKQRRRKANRKPQTHTTDKLVENDFPRHKDVARRKLQGEMSKDNEGESGNAPQHWPSSSCRFQSLVVGRRIMDLRCESAGGRTQEKRRAADKEARADSLCLPDALGCTNVRLLTILYQSASAMLEAQRAVTHHKEIQR
ncbi:hypothetical protein C8R45DRAFT_1019013 [Mycena sanguinolenta]|nr:hypothetical protein C8R45DRAFT_1019013 [Mycena sanguinolenta]